MFLPVSRKEIKKHKKFPFKKDDYDRGTEKDFQFQDGEEDVRLRNETDKMTQFR